MNQWPGRVQELLPGPAAVPVLSIIRTLFWGPDVHPDPATGRPGSVRRRAVPSSGGCYPVQVHVVCGTGCDVPSGLYAFDSERGILVRRDVPLRAAGGQGAVVVFTVLPQRTAARYHHRALPLLLADTAYAVTALAHHAAWHGVEAAWIQDDPEAFAALLGLPGYGGWDECWPATAPELALAAVSLGVSPSPGPEPGPLTPGEGPLVAPERRPRVLPGIADWAAEYRPGRAVLPYRNLPGAGPAELRARRSLPLTIEPPEDGRAAETGIPVVRTLLDRARRNLPGAEPETCRSTLLTVGDEAGRAALRDPRLAERCAGQRWTATLDGLLLLESDGAPEPREVWWAASLAAHVLYASVATAAGTAHRLEFRPVSGWTGENPGRLTLHGLGFRVRRTR